MTNTNEPTWTDAKVLMYAAAPGGLAIYPTSSDELLEVCHRLADEGRVRWDSRDVEIPATPMPESCKAVAMFDTWSARTIHMTTVHLVRWER